MFWVYVPPIVFIAALVALVVILGKKTSALKMKGAFHSRVDHFPAGETGNVRFKKFWKLCLKLLERIIFLIKAGIRKSEAGLSGALHKIKEKRLERKIPKPLPDDYPGESRDYQENLDILRGAREIRKAGGEEISSQDINYSHKEVIVRKKEEPIPQRIMPEIVPEDKVREEALIHRIAENPKDVEAYRELGDYYMSVGNIKDAKDSFKMVLKLRPRDLKAKSSLREIEMKMRLGS